MQKLKYIFLWISLSGFSILNAQDDKPEAFWNKGIVKDFKRIQTETEAYYKDRFKGKGSGYKQWKRWEYNQQDRLSPNGEVNNYLARNGDAMQEFLRDNPQSDRMALNTWAQWGQNIYVDSTGLPGTGVLNCVAFDNDNANVIYTGGPACGLWKTVNGGTSWFNVTDNINNAIRGISGIAVNHQNDNIIYILTGDGDGKDSPSLGVWKSTNGGTSWQATGLIWGLNELKYGYKIAMNPVNPNILIVATHNNGLYRTSDGGTTWTNHESGTFYDVVWKPGSSTEVYGGKSSTVWKSNDAGISWTSVAFLPNSERMQLGVTPQNPNYVFALGSGYVNQGGNSGFPGFIRSINSGANWFIRSNQPSICAYNGCIAAVDTNNTQATYNIDFAVKPNSTEIIVSGAVNIYNSLNGGSNWTRRTLWCDSDPINEYVHPDIHGMEYNVLNNKLYIVGDGGIYVSLDDGVTFQDITSNMELNAFFDLAGTLENSNFMLGGLYHNGTRKFTGSSTAPTIFGGDGAGCMIDHSDQNKIYYSYQQGNIYRSTNGGVSGDSIKPSPDNGPFNTKLAMSPINGNEIYVGWKKDTIYRSSNSGTSYSYSVFPYDFLYNSTPEDVKYIDVSPIPSIVYACTDETVFRSTDFGATWTNIYYPGEDFTSVEAITAGLAIITRGGYDDGDKVYLYDANSNSTTNISNDLPNVPVWIAAYSPNNVTGEIYVGTDLGVYKSEYPYTSWNLFGTNVVNIPVVDLVIYPTQSKIRAATYGRGILQSDITCSFFLDLNETNDPNFGTPIFEANQASSFMTVSRKVQGSNGDVTYKAGSEVILTNGFLATQGNKVIVKTNACGVD